MLDKPMSQTIVLREERNAKFPKHKVVLVQVTAGWEPAGAGMREIKSNHLTVFQMIDGARYGRNFKAYSDALVEFERLTGRTASVRAFLETGQ